MSDQSLDTILTLQVIGAYAYRMVQYELAAGDHVEAMFWQAKHAEAYTEWSEMLRSECLGAHQS